MYSTVVFLLGMVPCLAVSSSTSSMPSTTSTRILVMSFSMVVSPLTVFLFMHWSKVLLMEASLLLN